MKKEQFIKLGMTEAGAQKAMEIFKEELKGYIPKSRFDQVNDIKKELEKKLILKENQLAELNTNRFTCKELKSILEDLWKTNASLMARQEETLKELLIRTAIRSRLVNVKYAGLLFSQFDKSKLSVEADGTVNGIEEQLEELKRVYEGLFHT